MWKYRWNFGTMLEISWWLWKKNIIKNFNFVAGGILQEGIKICEGGQSGVQIGTRFMRQKECNAHEKYKEMFVKAKERHHYS